MIKCDELILLSSKDVVKIISYNDVIVEKKVSKLKLVILILVYGKSTNSM